MTEIGSFPEPREIKRKARELLGQRNVILKLIFASVLCWIINIAVELAETCVYYTALQLCILDAGSEIQLFVLTLVFELVALLCVAAMAMGTVRLAWLLTKDPGTRLTEMFYYWHSPKRYFRSILIFLSVAALPKLFLFSLSYVIFDILPLIYLNTPNITGLIAYFFALIGVFIVGFLLGALLLLPYSLLSSAVALFVKSDKRSVGACIFQSARATRSGLTRIFKFRFSFVPLILLSVVTVGVLLVIYAVPYMLVSYFYYNAALFEDEISAADMEVTFDER